MPFLALLAIAACQGDPAHHQLPAKAASAAGFLPKGWDQESQHTPDLNGDGNPDLVLVVVGPENEPRVLLAALAGPGGYRNIGEANLPTYPLGEAQVKFTDRKVLVVEDLVGGTTATATTMRYRYEAKPEGGDGMRYIGVDVSLYSRTNQHDARNVSQNWLTGERVVQVDRLTRDGEYDPQKPKRTKGAPARYFMEDTADPESIL